MNQDERDHFLSFGIYTSSGIQDLVRQSSKTIVALENGVDKFRVLHPDSSNGQTVRGEGGN